MRRALVLLWVAMIFSGCFDFDRLLSNCRTDAGWGCGPSSDGGEPDGGSLDPGPTTGLVCMRGWCWENPRPVGTDLTSVLALGENDLWVGGVDGTLLHFDGGGWSAEPLAPNFHVNAMCAHRGELFAGGTEGLLRRTGETWDVVLSTLPIVGLSCRADSDLRYVHPSGARSWSPGGGEVTLFDVTSPESCSSILSHADGGCTVVCRDDGVSTPFTHARDCEGTIRHTFTDGGGSAVISRMWDDPVRGPMVGVSQGDGRLYQLSGSAWTPAWDGAPGEVVYAGTAYQGGSLAVGRYGLSVTLGAPPTSPMVTSVRQDTDTYLFDVSVAPTGTAWTVGQYAELYSRDAGSGSWRSRSTGNDRRAAYGLVIGPNGISAVGEHHLRLVRGEDGWRSTEPFLSGDHYLDEWEGPSGRVTLEWRLNSVPRLHLPGLNPITLSGDDPRLFVVDESWAVVSTDTGVYRVELSTGATTQVVTGPIIGLTGDRSTRTIYAATPEGILSSTGGDWTPIAGAPAATQRLEAGQGQLWAFTDGDNTLHQFDGQRWDIAALSATQFITAVVPVGAWGERQQAALVFSTSSGGLQAWVVHRVPNGLLADPIEHPPTQVSRGLRHRDEVWVVGQQGAVLRFRVP